MLKLIGKTPYFEFYLNKKQVVTDKEVAKLISLYGEETNISSRLTGDSTEYFEGNRPMSRETAYCLLERWQDFKISKEDIERQHEGYC